MKLTELSEQYRQSAEPLRGRIAELRRRLDTEELCELERLRLRRRVCVLSTMLRETIAVSRYLENYYGGDNNGRETTEPVYKTAG